ncbi:MAG: hypothetical protein A2Z88_09720 [Omnitrophica WOR_2 bacterium GWA2_47_8]|nr:MAG: hypothetical protein A2Z88_09720 [Omnitrophica WOR_2 bacterium GWA2_47_8]
MFKKIIFIAIALIFILILCYIGLFFISPPLPKETVYGVTFSRPYAQSALGLEWKEVYLAILDELEVKNIRIPIYWNEIEPEQGKFYFEDYDFIFQEAQKRGANIIPVVGQRLPRWPECHEPEWAKSLDRSLKQERIITMLKIVIDRYNGYPNIKMWQVENEPFLPWFGICPKLDKNFLKKEVELARSKSNRPILITESGELSTWYQASRLGDYLGTTLYRKVFEENLKFYWTYPIPKSLYWIRASFNGKPLDKVIVSELQAEPWVKNPPIPTVPLDEQYQTMNLKTFKENSEFAKSTGISEIYLWGAEWWYWLKEKKGDPNIWNEAKTLFRR